MTIPVNAQPIIDWFFENNGAESLGAAVGLDPETSRRVLAQGLPRQLQALADGSQTRVGAGQVAEAVRIIPHFPSVIEALSMGQGAADLLRAGNSLAPTLLGAERTRIAESVAGQTGAGRTALGRLFDMTLPLILSRLSWRDDAALRFLPLVGGGLVREGTHDVLIPTNAAVAPQARRALPAAVREETRRGGFPLWILPLVLLLLLGGCWTLNRGRTTSQAEVTEAAKTSLVTSQFTVTNPAKGSEVSANGFTVEGTGPVGQGYSMYRAGEKVGEFTVGDDNRWRVDVLDAATPVGDVVYTFRDASGNAVDSLNVRAKGPDAAVAATPMTVSAPVAGSDVSAGGFSISGTGQPNATYAAYEDGTNIGNFTVAPDGTWSVDVPGPAAGKHTYTILDGQGNRVALLPVNVAAGAGGGPCTDALTVSLNDNETVTAPFRFGGRGGGTGYTVSVWRGDRQVGTQDVKLTGDCTWSYASNPGGQEGQKSVVRYEVRPSGAATSTPAAGQVTLNVAGSGSNFNSKGEYIDPTK